MMHSLMHTLMHPLMRSPHASSHALSHAASATFDATQACCMITVSKLQDFLLVWQGVAEVGVGRHILWQGATRGAKRA